MSIVAEDPKVIPFPVKADADDWLTTERLEAYYVALSINKDIAHAAPLVREGVIDQVIAGLRAARKCEDALDAKGRDQCIRLMRYDAMARAERLTLGGW